jgi:hypothetical protein
LTFSSLTKSKRADHLGRREELPIALRPAEPHQIVAERVGQVAHLAIGLDAERAMALRQLGTVGAVDQRDVRHRRHAPPERLVDLRLPGGVGQMVVAADDLGDAHVVIVGDHREHIGRRPVRAQQHEIVEVLVGPGDATLHLVLDHRFAILWRAQADHRFDAGRRLRRIAVAPVPVVAGRPLLGARLLAHRVELGLAGVAAVGVALGQKFVDDRPVPLDARELVDDVAIPLQAEPVEPVDDRVDGVRSRALAVGVLDAQQHPPAEAPRIEPVEQGRARAADVQKTGRGWCETRDDVVGHG